MRAALVFIAALCAPALASDLFATWMLKHGKVYSSPEEQTLRAAIFAANVDKINAHNMKGLSWEMGINEFADLTSTEFAVGRIGGFVPRTLRRESANVVELELAPNAPSSVDWRKQGAVTPVKNQGQCGSCWSFSTTGSLEGAGKIFKGKLASLSEQQLVDCSTAYGNQGCNGGLMDDAFQYVIANKGLCTEASYPYTATGPNTCKTSCSVVTTSAITKYTDVPTNSDAQAQAAVIMQPVSIAIEADQNSFQLYNRGVMTQTCGTQLDHGVLNVGYGVDPTAGAYYIVKNSWGASWGEAGYIRLGRYVAGGSQPNYNNGAGQCGMFMAASYPGY